MSTCESEQAGSRRWKSKKISIGCWYLVKTEKERWLDTWGWGEVLSRKMKGGGALCSLYVLFFLTNHPVHAPLLPIMPTGQVGNVGLKRKEKREKWSLRPCLASMFVFYVSDFFLSSGSKIESLLFCLSASEYIWVRVAASLFAEDLSMEGWSTKMITNGFHQQCLLSFSTGGRSPHSFLHFYERTCLATIYHLSGYTRKIINRASMHFHWFHMPDPSCRSTVLPTVLVTPRHIYSPTMSYVSLLFKSYQSFYTYWDNKAWPVLCHCSPFSIHPSLSLFPPFLTPTGSLS